MPQAKSSDLLMGAAAVEVTPPWLVSMSGFAARTQRSRGVHDPLFARALAVGEPGKEPVVLVSIDCIGVDASLTAAVRRGLSAVPPSRVAVVATHTHGGPATLRHGHLGDIEDRVLDSIVAGAIEAGARACAALEPVTLRFGTAPAPGLARNRRDPSGPVDDEVAVMSFWRQGATTPAAALVSFAMHPVVLGSDNLLLTRDYVGYLVDGMERHYPGCTALFACGCAGQINTGHKASASWSTGAQPDRTFAAARTVGGKLLEAAVIALGERSTPVSPGRGVRAAVTDVALPLTAPDPPASQQLVRLAAELAEARVAGDQAREGLLRGMESWAKMRLAAEQSSEGAGSVSRTFWNLHERAVSLQAFALGDAVIALLPGEPFVEYGLALKAAGRPLLMTVGYANDAPGYLPTAAALAEGGYEVETAFQFYGLPGPYRRDIEATLMSACEQLLATVRPDRLQ